MGIDWETLIQERNAWVAHNFPNEVANNPGLGSVFGVIEELGELTHAHLKEDQAIRGSAEEHREAAKDAIGDLTVYLLGVMERWGLRPLVLQHEVNTTHYHLLMLASCVGRLAEGHGYAHKTMIGGAVTGIVRNLQGYCLLRDWDYKAIVQETWDHVKQRDWIKYPHDGLTA